MKRCVLQEIPLFISGNVVQAVHLSAAAAVPSSAVRNQGIAQRSDGAIYVTQSGAEVAYVHGTKVRKDGALFVTSSAPTVYIAGIGHTDVGAISAVAAGTADGFDGGVPIVLGKVRVSTL